jgi:hypothetical protein
MLSEQDTFYEGLPARFLAAVVPKLGQARDHNAFFGALHAHYTKLGTVGCARNLDDWLDRLTPQQLRLLYQYEHSEDESKSSVLMLIVYQFLLLATGRDHMNTPLILHHYETARRHIAARLGWELDTSTPSR